MWSSTFDLSRPKSKRLLHLIQHLKNTPCISSGNLKILPSIIYQLGPDRNCHDCGSTIILHPSPDFNNSNAYRKKKETNKKRLLKKKKKTQTVSTMTDIGIFLKGLRETLLQQNSHSISRWLSIVQAKARLGWSTFLNKLPLNQSVCLAVNRSTSVKDDQFFCPPVI